MTTLQRHLATWNSFRFHAAFNACLRCVKCAPIGSEKTEQHRWNVIGSVAKQMREAKAVGDKPKLDRISRFFFISLRELDELEARCRVRIVAGRHRDRNIERLEDEKSVEIARCRKAHDANSIARKGSKSMAAARRGGTRR